MNNDISKEIQEQFLKWADGMIKSYSIMPEISHDNLVHRLGRIEGLQAAKVNLISICNKSREKQTELDNGGLIRLEWGK